MSQPEYLTREIAAQRLGISERRVLDLAARGLIARKSIRDDRTGQKMYIYPAKDVDPSQQLHPPASPPLAARRVALLPTRHMQAAELHTQSMPYNPAPAAQLPRWLTVPQASVYIGLPAGYLRRLIREGQLPAIDLGKSAIGGRWRVSRKDLAAIQGDIHRKP